jgi:hypothetical protein
VIRISLFLWCALALVFTVSSGEKGLDPLRPHGFEIQAKPVSLMQGNTAVRTIGTLTYIEGWSLSSWDRNFGGLSALAVDGTHFKLVSDVGEVISFDMYGGHFSNARVDSLPKGCGDGWVKKNQDSESFAVDPKTGRSWIGLEVHNFLCLVPAGSDTATEIAPHDMADWPHTGGPESMVWLKRGGLLVLAERDDDDAKPVTPAVYFPGGPERSNATAIRLGYQAPAGYRAVDARELPDGRVLVLNRRYEPPINFMAKLVVIDPPQLVTRRVLKGREIAAFEAPFISDNFEGLSVQPSADGLHIWIVSDDNFSRPLQRTLLLHLIWKEPH